MTGGFPKLLRDRFRFVVIGISLICLTFVFGNPLIFNFTVICMTRAVNGTAEPMFAAEQRAWLFSVVAVGNLTATLVITHLTRLLGGRLTCTLYGLVSGVATVLMPLCADWGFAPLVAARILQGAGAGTTLAAISLVSHAWSPLSSMGLVISVISCYVQLGPLYTLPVASLFCESHLSWRFAYYLQGALTVCFVLVFYGVYRDSPRDVSLALMSDKELQLLEKNKHSPGQGGQPGKEPPIPYVKIFTDPSVLGVMLCGFGSLLGQQIFLIYGAVYLNQVLDLSVEMTGVSALVANAFCLVFKLAVSPVSDHARCFSEKTRAKAITSASHAVMAASFFILAAFVDRDRQLLGQTCYLLTIVFSSLQSVGFMKTNQLANRQYAYVVMSVVACLNCCIVLLLPLFMSVVAPDNTIRQWHSVFWIVGGVIVVTTGIFNVTAKTDPRPWTGHPCQKSCISPAAVGQVLSAAAVHTCEAAVDTDTGGSAGPIHVNSTNAVVTQGKSTLGGRGILI